MINNNRKTIKETKGKWAGDEMNKGKIQLFYILPCGILSTQACVLNMRNLTWDCFSPLPCLSALSITVVVTESTIIATIHCPDVGYCLFGNPLVTHIPDHVPCTFLIVIVSYWVVLFFICLLAPLAPCTQLGYSTLPTMYYWISTSVAISYLFDCITCIVSYILWPLHLCFRT